MVEESKNCRNEGIMRSLQEVIKRPLKSIIPMRGFDDLNYMYLVCDIWLDPPQGPYLE